MEYIYKVATINLNSSNSSINQGLLKDFVQDNDVDVLLLQEVVYENFLFLPSHYAFVNISSDNKGTAILVRKSMNISNVLLESNGRIVSLVVNGVNFVNVYAHSGSNYRRERNDLFTNLISVHLSKQEASYSVIGGDFNCTLEEGDRNAMSSGICAGLKNLVDLFRLKDVAKEKKKAEYTFFRGESASRLDRFYAPVQFVENVTSVSTVPVAFSDHSAVIMKVRTSQSEIVTRGRGYWKINPSILEVEDITSRFEEQYEILKTRAMYTADLSSWWNFVFKPKCRRFYKSEAWKINSAIRNDKSEQLRKLIDLNERRARGEDVSILINLAKSRLMEIEHNRLSNYSKKLPESNFAEGEKISVFQVSNQVHRGVCNQQLKLSSEDGLVSDREGLGNIIQSHFQALFQGVESDDNQQDPQEDPLNYITRSVNDEEATVLCEPITVDEIWQTLKICNKKKTPGPDGLTYEFYLKHFPVLKDDICRLFNGYLSGIYIPPKDFTSGIVTLIPKKGDLTQLENFRPITLLNADYKLFSKILANRTQPLLGNLLGPGQSACIKEKSCIDNLEDLRKLFTKSIETKRLKGFIVSLDLEKAFDRVHHPFLWKTLQKFKFPDQIINCIKNLYANANSKIMFNGFLTPEFQVRSSVRQGCPLSMLMFVLYIESLIRKIYANTCGILVYNNILKVIAYADDLNVFVRSDEEFDLIIQIITSFARFAKIQLNLNKSRFLRINNCSSGPQLIKEADELKVLGVVFKKTWSESIDRNFDKLVSDVKHRLTVNRFRKLNLLQRVWFINTFVLAKLWYTAQIFPPKNVHLAKIKSAVGMFLWHNNVFKLDRKQLYLPYEKGGLGLQDPEAKCKALFLKSILRSHDVNNENYLLQFKYPTKLTRNTREWLEEARFVKQNYDIESCKMLYIYFLEKDGYKPKIEILFPELDWEIIWNNISKPYLHSEDRSKVYELINDLIPNKKKLVEYGIRRMCEMCEECNEIDTNEHRLKFCTVTSEIRLWVEAIIRQRIKIEFNDLEIFLISNLENKCVRQRSALWLVCHYFTYVLKCYPKCSLFVFKKSIREIRWSNREGFKNNFESFLNIC